MTTGYHAFISYARDTDRDIEVARQLQHGLQRFARPWYRVRALRVFRDHTDLAAGPLWSTIEHALEHSDWLILVASPSSAASTGVARELDWWLRHKSDATHRLLLALTDGDIQWNGDDFDWHRTTALHPRCAGRFSEEPLWIDLRGDTYVADPDGIANFAAPVLGVGKDTVLAEHRRQRRRTRLTLLLAAVLAVVLTASTAYAGFLADQRGEREAEARETAVARALASAALAAAPTSLDRAAVLIAEAYRRRPADDRVRSALLTISASSPQLTRFLRAEARVTSLFPSADGRVFAAGTADGHVTLWSSRGDRVATARLGEAPVTRLALSRDGSTVVAGIGTTAVVWRSGAPADRAVALRGAVPLAAVTLSPSGQRVGVVRSRDYDDHEITVHRSSDGAVVNRITSDTLSVQRLTMSDDDTVRLCAWRGQVTTFSGHPLAQRGERTYPRLANYWPTVGKVAFPTNCAFSMLNIRGSLTVTPSVPGREAEEAGGKVAIDAADVMTVSTDGKRAAVATAGAIQIAEVSTQNGSGSALPGNSVSAVLTGVPATASIEFLGGGDHVISANGPAVVLWDLTRAGRTARWAAAMAFDDGFPHRVPVRSPPRLLISADGRRAVVESEGPTRAYLVDTATMATVGELPESSLRASSDVFAPLWISADGREVIGTAGRRWVRWRADARLEDISSDLAEDVAGVGTGPAPGEVVVVAASGAVTLRRTSDWTLVRQLRGPERSSSAEARAVAFRPDGGAVAFTLLGRVLVVDTRTGVTTSPAVGTPRTLAYPDRVLLAAFEDGSLRRFGDGRQQLVAPGDARRYPSGGQAVTTDESVYVRVREAESGAALEVTDTRTGVSVGTLPLPFPRSFDPTSTAIRGRFVPHSARLLLVPFGNHLLSLDLDEKHRVSALCDMASRDLSDGDWPTTLEAAPPPDRRCDPNR
ncbi:toll/interleukin-1 receptor domain-containing protein [Cryptosporangium japonicum]|uniref:TIR domain-containing protein n=1 Tax=Cryptosporangium japonicum TaxID=80872 RepID=A0ABN0U2Q8_9ACTN